MGQLETLRLGLALMYTHPLLYKSISEMSLAEVAEFIKATYNVELCKGDSYERVQEVAYQIANTTSQDTTDEL